MRTVLTMAMKDLRLMSRDWLGMFFIIGFPIAMALFFGQIMGPFDTKRASMNIARKSSSGKITLSAAGQSVTADGYEMTWDGDVQTGAGKSTFKLSNIAIPPSLIAMMDPGGTLKQQADGHSVACHLY